MKRFYLVSVAVLFSVLVACQGQSSDQRARHETIVVAKIKNPVEKLYFSGVLEPLSMQSVLSPVDGRVVKLNFSYGQTVKKGQSLLAIDSIGLTQDYRKSISDYLQKKSAYANSLEEFRGSQALYKAGVISREEFINSRTQYRTNQLNYYQSRYAMEKILLKANVNPKEIEHLTIDDAGKVNALLQRQFKHVVVRSAANGIALFPIKSEESSDDSAKKLELGSPVKSGQLLLTVGNLTGLSTKIHVNEVNIDRIHSKMTAIVSVNAFPDLKLKGYVSTVSSQAKATGQSSGLSEFPVVVKIPKIMVKQRDIIRVGMTAKVMILVHQQPTILLPIDAIFEKHGESVVMVVNKLGQRKAVPVVVGTTTPTQAAILHGIKPEDRIVVPQGGRDDQTR